VTTSIHAIGSYSAPTELNNVFPYEYMYIGKDNIHVSKVSQEVCQCLYNYDRYIMMYRHSCLDKNPTRF